MWTLPLKLDAMVPALAWHRWRHPDLPPPDAAPACEAEVMVWSYGLPLLVYAGVVIGIFCMFGSVALLGDQWAAWNLTGNIFWWYAAALCCLFAVLHMRFNSDLAFPDRPFIWAGEDGLTIANRFRVPWDRLAAIDLYLESGRRGPAEAGLTIAYDVAGDRRTAVIPFFNATSEASDCIDHLRDQSIAFGARLQAVSAESRSYGLRVANHYRVRR